jgi:hypothetical protein
VCCFIQQSVVCCVGRQHSWASWIRMSRINIMCMQATQHHAALHCKHPSLCCVDFKLGSKQWLSCC